LLAFFTLALLGFRPLPGSGTWPIPLSAFAAFLVLALLALSLAGRSIQLAALPLLSEIAIVALALPGRAFLFVSLTLLALSTFLTPLAGRALLIPLA
jgi:hypothetical protein